MFFKGDTVDQVINKLKNGGIAIVPTDTLYGIICDAKNKSAVNKLYKVKERDTGKPCIVLVNSYEQIKSFGIDISPEQKEFMDIYWHFDKSQHKNPESVSVILPCTIKKYEYLHRGVGSIAFRMIGPRSRNLYKIIDSVGPVLAPSANPQGKEPATCENKAKKYFGDRVDSYLCGGTRRSLPSTLVDYTGKKIKIIRMGKVLIKK